MILSAFDTSLERTEIVSDLKDDADDIVYSLVSHSIEVGHGRELTDLEDFELSEGWSKAERETIWKFMVSPLALLLISCGILGNLFILLVYE